jgi:hypothetical protein
LQVQNELATQRNLKNSIEDKVHGLEEQLNEVSFVYEQNLNIHTYMKQYILNNKTF